MIERNEIDAALIDVAVSDVFDIGVLLFTLGLIFVFAIFLFAIRRFSSVFVGLILGQEDGNLDQEGQEKHKPRSGHLMHHCRFSMRIIIGEPKLKCSRTSWKWLVRAPRINRWNQQQGICSSGYATSVPCPPNVSVVATLPRTGSPLGDSVLKNRTTLKTELREPKNAG